MTARWDVVRQTTRSEAVVYTGHPVLAELRRWLELRRQDRRGRRSVQAGYDELGVFYFTRPAAVPPETSEVTA